MANKPVFFETLTKIGEPRGFVNRRDESDGRWVPVHTREAAAHIYLESTKVPGSLRSGIDYSNSGIQVRFDLNSDGISYRASILTG